MQELLDMKWKSTRVDTPPMDEAKCKNNLSKLGNEWKLINSDVFKLSKEFKFPNFVKALDFVNKVGEFAEEKNHHPNLTLTWGRAGVTIWTHRIKGLALMDFVFAANIEKIFRDNFA